MKIQEQTHLRLRDNDFAYTDTGLGSVVLNAHGVTQSHRSGWSVGFPDYSPVAEKGARLISYDARGHGCSSGQDDPRLYTWPALAVDMLSFADHFSPDAPVGVIGCSMGTGTLLHAVVQRPDRFSKLVVTAAPTAWETRASQVELFLGVADAAEKNPQGHSDMRSAAPMGADFAGPPDYPADPDVQTGLLPAILRGAGLTDLPPTTTLRSIRQPTLILAWAGDPGHPVSTATRLAESIPHSELLVATTYAEVERWGDLAADFLIE